MQAVKAVKQNYLPTQEVLALLEFFRLMVNDCVRIGIEENVSSLKSLSLKAYRQLSAYQIPSYYKLCAISKATGILRNYLKSVRKNPHTKRPYARKLMLTTCYGFKVEDGLARLPLGHRTYVDIPLTAHTKAILADPRITVRSICLTACTLSVAFSKETALIEPRGAIGVDRNLDNVTVAIEERTQRFDLSKASRIKAVYREVKSHLRRNDVRIRRRIYGKYGKKQGNRVNQLLHHVSKAIVGQAKDSQSAIVMENLTGIRRLYRRGNNQGRDYRARLNSWSFYELQRQIEYKARWEGIPVIYVSARDTSKKCSVCGCRLATIPEESRLLKCSIHGTVDRDVNAARNILAKGGLRFGPVVGASETMKGNEPTMAPILRVDAPKVIQRGT